MLTNEYNKNGAKYDMNKQEIILHAVRTLEHAVAYSVEALYYKAEGCRIDS
jgi:hypothetical protein